MNSSFLFSSIIVSCSFTHPFVLNHGSLTSRAIASAIHRPRCDERRHDGESASQTNRGLRGMGRAPHGHIGRKGIWNRSPLQKRRFGDPFVHRSYSTLLRPGRVCGSFHWRHSNVRHRRFARAVVQIVKSAFAQIGPENGHFVIRRSGHAIQLQSQALATRHPFTHGPRVQTRDHQATSSHLVSSGIERPLPQ